MSAGGRKPEQATGQGCKRRDQRNRGLAQALLVDAYGRARDHGVMTGGLSTDSRTGALSLYEKVGMQVTSTWVNRGIDL